ncbi:MAG: hypothetical protein ACNYPF_03740 [Candidatus Puniceispirillales bacterium WSBS_2018_MAG_OTU23]
MKINVDFTPLEMASEEMEGLYRDLPAAKREAASAKAKYGTDYEIKEVTQSVQGKPAQTYWKLVPRIS